MGAFQYVAVDPRGKEKKGVLEGDSARHVRQLLRERELLPVQVDQVETAERKRSRSVSLRRGVGGLDLAIITRQLATLVRAGLPLDEALSADLFLNQNYGLPADLVRRARRSVLLDIDPGLLQVWASHGWMPIARSSRTECCVGLVFNSPAAPIHGTRVK